MNDKLILETIRTLPAIFSHADFRKAAEINKVWRSNWHGYCTLLSLVDQKLLYKKRINERVTRWSLSPFPEEAPKKPLGRVFTAEEYGDYYNYTDSYKMLHRAFKAGSVYKVGKLNTIGKPVLWSFHKEDSNSELALNKANASAIIPSAIKDPFANIFR